jgi:hemoglobin
VTSLHEAMGGSERIRDMTERFLRKAMVDDLLEDLFAGKLDHAEHIAGYFDANFGGPDTYLRERGGLRFLLAQHVGLEITEGQRARWVELMTASAVEAGVPDQARAIFASYLVGPSHTTVQVSNLPVEYARRQLGLDASHP